MLCVVIFALTFCPLLYILHLHIKPQPNLSMWHFAVITIGGHHHIVFDIGCSF